MWQVCHTNSFDQNNNHIMVLIKRFWCGNSVWYDAHYSVPGRGASYCDELVCLSVHTHISRTCPKFRNFFCAHYLWPWLGPLLVALWCVMYFWFWDDVILFVHNGPYDASRTSSNWLHRDSTDLIQQARSVYSTWLTRWQHQTGGRSLMSTIALCTSYMLRFNILHNFMSRNPSKKNSDFWPRSSGWGVRSAQGSRVQRVKEVRWSVWCFKADASNVNQTT